MTEDHGHHPLCVGLVLLYAGFVAEEHALIHEQAIFDQSHYAVDIALAQKQYENHVYTLWRAFAQLRFAQQNHYVPALD